MDEKMLELAKQIKILRVKKDLSQKDLAKVSGISECTITFIENGKFKPRGNTLVKLAKALDVDADELLKYII